MRCKFRIAGESKEPGFTKYVCQRCGMEGHSPYGLDRVIGDCYGWPLWHEFGQWLSLLLEAVGITKSGYSSLRRRLGFKGNCGCGKREAAADAIGDGLRRSLPPPPG